MGGHRCFNTQLHKHTLVPTSGLFLTDSSRLQSHCVFGLGEAQPTWQSFQHHHLKALTFYWQSAFLEHIDSEQRTSAQQFIKSNCVFPRSSQTFGACYTTLQDQTAVLLLWRKVSPASSDDDEPLISHGSHCLVCSLHTSPCTLPSERYLFHL